MKRLLLAASLLLLTSSPAYARSYGLDAETDSLSQQISFTLKEAQELCPSLGPIETRSKIYNSPEFQELTERSTALYQAALESNTLSTRGLYYAEQAVELLGQLKTVYPEK
jgi:hypothetical protein